MRFRAFLFLLVSPLALAQTRVAVVDTGLNLEDPRFKSALCASGHKDFTGHGIGDFDGHGTHVAGLIKRHAGNADYCLIILKFYLERDPGGHNLRRAIAAFREAVLQGATVVNFSGGGGEYIEEERVVIASAPGVTFMAAAGNESQNIGRFGTPFYPASYDLPNVRVVGALTPTGEKLSSSNYGSRVEYWEVGVQSSTLPYGREGEMRGTSQATAVATGKLLAGTLMKRSSPIRLKLLPF